MKKQDSARPQKVRRARHGYSVPTYQMDLGWGPVSSLRPFDFTPCFEQGVLIPICLIFLLIVGVPRVWILLRDKGDHAGESLRGRKSWFMLQAKLVRSLTRMSRPNASVLTVPRAC